MSWMKFVVLKQLRSRTTRKSICFILFGILLVSSIWWSEKRENRIYKQGLKNLHIGDGKFKCHHSTPFIGGYPGPVNFRFISCDGVETISEHHRFNASEMQHHMPADTRYFTILRNPWSQFQSSYNYYKTSLNKLVSNVQCRSMPIKYVTNGTEINVLAFLRKSEKLLNKTVPWYFRFKNSQAHDLGLDPMMEDEEEINKKILELDSQIDSVLISEHMDESMILLKNLLCAKLDDLVYQNGKTKNYEHFSLSHSDWKTFQRHNKVDIALYDYFYKKFKNDVEAFGLDNMEKETLKLRKMIKNVTSAPPRKDQHSSSKQKFKKWSKIGKLSTAEDIASRIRLPKKKAVKMAKYMMSYSGHCYELIS
ncbi:galactosylceramide sulfotransferase-like isoform X2 [Clavelina lepadiformis]|uniref:galactosylceramide sulfotransferase-like isoform X2 n=1 Tax=Clavelina lepadiformis TaxID=159417 RepID=UPI0040437158